MGGGTKKEKKKKGSRLWVRIPVSQWTGEYGQTRGRSYEIHSLSERASGLPEEGGALAPASERGKYMGHGRRRMDKRGEENVEVKAKVSSEDHARCIRPPRPVEFTDTPRLPFFSNNPARVELIAWINDLLGSQYTKIEQCGTGAVYCQVSSRGGQKEYLTGF